MAFLAVPMNDLKMLNLELFIAIFFICCLLILCVVFPLYLYIKNLKQKILEHKKENRNLMSVLETTSEARCWWTVSDEKIHSTHGLIHLLGLNNDHPIQLIDLMNQFMAKDAALLSQHVRKLQVDKQSFNTECRLNDQKTILNICGAYYAEAQQLLFVLSMIDITKNQNDNRRHLQLLSSITAEKNRLQVMVDAAPIALWYRNAENQIDYCNLVYAGVLDSTPEQIVLEKRELVDKHRSLSPYQLAVRAKETGESHKQRGHIVIDGCRRLIEMTEMPLQDQDATIGYALDLTEIEESTNELTKHIKAHQEVLHHLSTPIAIYGPDTRLEFFNMAYIKLFQFEETWLHKKPLFSDILQDLRERRKLPEHSDFKAFKREQLHLFNTLIHPMQELIHQPDGQIARVMVAPHPLGGLFFLFEDVTDKLALERRYNTLIAVQKETLDHLYEGVVVFGSDNRLRLSNPAIERIWKLDSIDLVPGRHATEILDQLRHMFMGYSDWDKFKDQLLGLISQRQARTGRFNRPDHSMIQYSYVPLPDGSHLLSFVDVSDRWRFEQALQERNHALERADRLKSDFISHVSYELRAPLNTIIGFTEILMNQYFGNLSERQMDYCLGISESSQRLLSLINDILDLASIEAGQLTLKLQTIDLNSFLSSLAGLVYNRSHDQGLEIIKKNETSIKTFIADERRLKQALFNLLTNAIKFTASGGVIELKAFTDLEKQQLCFSVSDTGVGISDEDRQRLFNLFETGQDHRVRFKQNGVGLGLPLVKSFVELHGGSIDIHSQLGKGTTVLVCIPLLTTIPASPSFETLSSEQQIAP